MIHKVLVALDGSPPARRAFDLATEISRASNAELILLHVLSDQLFGDIERSIVEAEYKIGFQMGPESSGKLVRSSYSAALGRAILSRAEEAAKSQRVGSVKTVLRDGDPASGILQVCDEERPDLIVMGSRGLGGIQRLFMGSVSQKVSHETKCSIVLVK